MKNDDHIADVLQALWETLDFRNLNDQIDNGGAAVHGRFKKLQKKLVELFTEKKVTKNQVKGILDYSHRTLFSHLQLFLSCLRSK
jgi:hypothetical protein